MRIGQAWTGEMHCRELLQPIFEDIELRVLISEDQLWAKPSRRKRGRDGRKLDRLRPSADDEPDVCGSQPSP
jgi:hypothetical protein